MNYGYNSDTKGWDESKKYILASRLLTELNLANQWIPGGTKPYIEVDGLYEGVRIRKITHLSDEDRSSLVKKADKIYNEVMGIKK